MCPFLRVQRTLESTLKRPCDKKKGCRKERERDTERGKCEALFKAIIYGILRLRVQTALGVLQQASPQSSNNTNGMCSRNTGGGGDLILTIHKCRQSSPATEPRRLQRCELRSGGGSVWSMLAWGDDKRSGARAK